MLWERDIVINSSNSYTSIYWVLWHIVANFVTYCDQFYDILWPILLHIVTNFVALESFGLWHIVTNLGTYYDILWPICYILWPILLHIVTNFTTYCDQFCCTGVILDWANDCWVDKEWLVKEKFRLIGQRFLSRIWLCQDRETKLDIGVGRGGGGHLKVTLLQGLTVVQWSMMMIFQSLWWWLFSDYDDHCMMVGNGDYLPLMAIWWWWYHMTIIIILCWFWRW